jgi:hypothetical protein
MTVSEIMKAFTLGLQMVQTIIEKIEGIQDENEKAKIKAAMDANDLDALRRLLFG